MLGSLIPPPIFQVALAACLMLPAWLATISLLAPRKLPAKHRLASAIVASPLFAITVGIYLLPELGSIQALDWIEITCAGLLYATAIMIVYSAWSLIGYGFTVSILMGAHLAGRSLKTDELMASLAGGRGLGGFALDRISVLLRMHLLLSEGDQFRIAGTKAFRFARTVKFAMGIYSISRRESK